MDEVCLIFGRTAYKHMTPEVAAEYEERANVLMRGFIVLAPEVE